MKITIISPSTKLTGGTRVIAELVNGLSKKGHEVSLVTLGRKEDHHWMKLSAPIIEVKRNLLQKITGYLYRMAFGFQPFPEEETRLLLKALPEADITLATMSYTGFAAYRNHRRSLPLQLHMHYEPLVREDGDKRDIFEEAYFLPIGKIANSTWLGNQIRERTKQDPVGMIFPAINHSVFYERTKRQPIGKGRKIKIVSLAKYKWWKGLPDALKAIEIVRKAGYDIDFLAFGGQFDSKTLPEEVQHIPFTFVGSKIDNALAEFYSDADILVSASYFESFPLPPLEAMACGIPVVTTRYGTEDYAFDRATALVVEPKDPQAMAHAIIELIENQELYLSLSKAGVTEAKKFTWERAVEDLEAIFAKELEKRAQTQKPS